MARRPQEANPVRKLRTTIQIFDLSFV
jgi:hypothetical protein